MGWLAVLLIALGIAVAEFLIFALLAELRELLRREDDGL